MPIPAKSDIPGIEWPPFMTGRAARQMAMLLQLEQSQWWPVERLREQQLRQARSLLRHALETVPWYRESIAGIRAEDLDSQGGWEQLPLLRRTDIQQAGDALHSTRVPPAHGKLGQIRTSGSTGRPVVVRTTAMTNFFWRVFTVRDHLWHRRDFSGKLAAIRHTDDPNVALPPRGARNSGWGPATDCIYATGPSVMLNVRSTIAEHAEWLQRENPEYLLTYPTLALALARHCAEAGIDLPGLKEVRAFGEVVSPQARQACREAWNVPLVDTYSSQEVGYMALQCPQHEHYHVQSENCILEVLDGDGRPCRPGETGRVVVTALHNFATPLIRYEIGDHARVGEPCSCGRGLPVLDLIHGRTRNLLRLPNGEVRWPVIGEKVRGLENLPTLRQFQVIQKSLELVEVRMVMPRELTTEEHALFTDMLQRTLGHPFEIRIVYCDTIERSAGGKFEEFVSEVS